MDKAKADRIVARAYYQNGSYWIYHKNLVDEGLDGVLEKKPEEKIWKVVRDHKNPEMNQACIKLQKRDLIKVGRVRFKIRNMMSPAYSMIEEKDDYRQNHFREMFPSLNDISSVSHSIIQSSHANDDDNEDLEN